MKLIRFVVVDELHLVNCFCQYFRKEFLALREPLFDKLTTEPILMMTATCTHRIRDSIQTMLGLNIIRKHWSFLQEMKHLSIYFDAQYSTHPMSYVAKSINPFVTASNGLGDKVIIYADTEKSIVNFAAKLGGIMDKDFVLTNIYIAAVIGRMKREAKAETLRIFFKNSLQSSLNLRILCCTSGVGNAGIDSPDITTVYRINFPPPILDICQERGRSGRRPGVLPKTYSYKAMFLIGNFSIYFQKHNESDRKCVVSIV